MVSPRSIQFGKKRSGPFHTTIAEIVHYSRVRYCVGLKNGSPVGKGDRKNVAKRRNIRKRGLSDTAITVCEEKVGRIPTITTQRGTALERVEGGVRMGTALKKNATHPFQIMST